jgi:hypothetical protein
MFETAFKHTQVFCIIVASVTLIACSSNDNDNDNFTPQPEYLPIANATVSLPPDVGSISLLSQNFDLGDVGYQQTEFFIEGTASAFTNVSELGSDGFWVLEPAEQAAYKTRIVVYSPVDPADFNGIVQMEWLNVTAGFETPPSWGTGQLEMRRGGSVWVGVSAQLIGIEGNDRGLLPLHLKAVDLARYGSLFHPGDSFSYDMFSQVANAIRNPGAIDVLGGLTAEYIIAYGESQSAGRLVTYVNGLQPLYGTFDGYMIHSRGDGASPISQGPMTSISAPAAPLVRTDLSVPVMTFETETDVVFLEFVNARQPDTDKIRTWEVALTAHGDYYTFVSGRDDKVGAPVFASVIEEPSIAGFITCDKPMNNGPQHYHFSTAVRALSDWVSAGTLPVTSPRLETNDDNSDYIYDALGNAVGGMRSPYADAPSAILRGEPNSGNSFCRLFGTTALFSAEQMASLYVDEAGYVEAVTAATNDAVGKGYLLPEDGEAIIAWAPSQWRSQTGGG